MSQFFEEIWDSVFTPGTNSSLLLATNASFAALQLVLFLLLVATYSIHFVILSALSAGLWWAINWFARELKAAQLLEDKKKKKEDKGEKEEEDDGDDDDDEAGEKKKRGARGGRGTTPRPGGWASTDSDTEVEAAEAAAAATAARKTSRSHHQQGQTGGGGDGISKEVETVEKRGELKHRAVGGASAAAPATASAATAAAEAGKSAATKAAAVDTTEPFPSLPLSPSGQQLSGSRSGVSTEDEWEKVSENEDK